MKTLTEKQKNIREFIEEFLDREGMAPTVYGIAAHFDIETSTVFAHLRALQRKKQLSRSSKARSISLINRPNNRNKVPQGALLIPLLGRVNAGAPAESLEYKEGEVCISSTLAPDCPPENLFALRVQGESMRLLTSSALPSEKSMKRAICFLKHSTLCSIVSFVIIFLISVFPDGSPIIAVPPPIKAIGLFPAI